MGTRVGIVGRGVIVCVGGMGVRLGVRVGGRIVAVAEAGGGGALSNVAGTHPVKISSPRSSPAKIRFIVFIPLLFLLSSFLFDYYYNGNPPTPVPPKKLPADR